MFRQDYRINNIFLPFQPPAHRPYASERRKAKSIIPLRGKAFNHCASKTVKQGEKHPLCFLGFIQKPWKKIKSIQLILSENILALCLN